MKFYLVAVCAFAVIIAEAECETITTTYHHAEVQQPIWGNVFPPYFTQIRADKFAVPLITRCNSFKYPEDLVSEVFVYFLAEEKIWFWWEYQKIYSQPDDAVKRGPIPKLRGIAHVNLVDKKETNCEDPDVKIEKGSYDGDFVKVKVCSKSGCPLDSTVYFYTR